MEELFGSKLTEYVENSNTCQFYKDKTLLVTGVTGFCGKVFFEKIARVLFPLKRVYILIRPKNNVNPQQRLEELLKSKIFTFFKYSNEHLDKFVAVSGDCSLVNLGLSNEDQITLINEVNIVFHCAASVKFDASIPFNFKQNTLGTKNMVDFVKQMKNIEHFVYLSTAYVNCHLQKTEDKVLEFEDDIDVIIEKFSNASTDGELEKIALPYFNGRPNSYVLTKALAECYVHKHCSNFDQNNNENENEKNLLIHTFESTEKSNFGDISDQNNLNDTRKNEKNFKTYIVRPSIVYNSRTEPAVGWIDSYNGPSGFAIFIFIGLIRQTKMRFNQAFQIVPVDYLANFMVSVPYLYSTQNNDLETKNKNIKVVTITYDKVQSYEIFKKGYKTMEKYPSLYMLRPPQIPSITPPKETWYIQTKRYILEDVWAYVIDFLFLLIGLKKKISIVRLLNKYKYACKLIEHFVDTDFFFPTQNFEKLVKIQDQTDAKLFNFNFENYDAEEIALNYILGTRRYLLKEPDSTFKIASIKFTIQKYLSAFLSFSLWFFIVYYIVSILKSFL